MKMLRNPSSMSASRLFRFGQPFKNRLRWRTTTRRYQTTDATAAAAASQGLASRLWNSPVGVKTVHFWAPVMKWAVVIAGVSDFYRPPDKLSLPQSLALTATGVIWTRWCLIIKPKNYLLASVNFLLGCVGAIQVSRIWNYQRSLKDQSTVDEIKATKDKVVGRVEDIAADAKAKVKENV